MEEGKHFLSGMDHTCDLCTVSKHEEKCLPLAVFRDNGGLKVLKHRDPLKVSSYTIVSHFFLVIILTLA